MNSKKPNPHSTVKVRIDGDPNLVSRIVAAISEVLRVESVSREYPRRDGQGVMVYLAAGLPAAPEEKPAATPAPAPDPSDHRCFYVDVDGEPVRVRGNPNMSQETRDALAEVVRKVREMNPPGEPDTPPEPPPVVFTPEFRQKLGQAVRDKRSRDNLSLRQAAASFDVVISPALLSRVESTGNLSYMSGEEALVNVLLEWLGMTRQEIEALP